MASGINSIFSWFENKISKLTPEMESLTEACDKLEGIDKKIQVLYQIKDSSLTFSDKISGSANRLFELIEMQKELEVDAKVIEDNKENTMAKTVRGFHSLIQNPTSLDKYSDDQNLINLRIE